MYVCKVIKLGCFKAYLCPNLISTLTNLKMNDFSHSDKDFSLSLSFQQRFFGGLWWVCLHAWIFKSQQKKRASYVFSMRMVFTILSLVSLTNFLQSYFNKKCVGRLITRQLVRINKWTFLFWFLSIVILWFCFLISVSFGFSVDTIPYCNTIMPHTIKLRYVRGGMNEVFDANTIQFENYQVWLMNESHSCGSFVP